MAEKTVRKRTTKKAATKKTTRKAPTRTKSVPVEKQTNYIPFIVLGVFVVILGVSVAIGFSDNGQIDINATVAERKVNASPEEKERLDSIPVQPARKDVPDGGLVPTTDVDPQTQTQAEAPVPTPEPVEADTTDATSSDKAATSTTEVSEDAESSNTSEDNAATTTETVTDENVTSTEE